MPTDPTARNDLLAAAAQMRASLQVLKDINAKANNIALSAAIEGARARGRHDAFSIVAEQIASQTARNGELSAQLDRLVAGLQVIALRSTAVRYYELAEDLIDRLDRNLFERNCDVQAWVTFESIIRCANEARSALAAPPGAPPSLAAVEACRILESLMQTYCVYDEVYLCDAQGAVIAAGRQRHLLGMSFAGQEWFQVALSGQVHVADMAFDPSISKFAVCYSAPVTAKDGKVIGVLSTRFNWSFAQEMIDSGGYDDRTQAYFMNRGGWVIGATEGVGIMRDSLDWMDAGRFAMKGHCGFSVESARNGAPQAVGFARTKGYNAYRGKEWSAVVASRIGTLGFEPLIQFTQDRTGTAVKAKLTGGKTVASEVASRELQDMMNQVNSLVAMINTTNRETNMLAINASIQAGKAGAEGESFAVLAVEIGKLAEESIEFVKSVNQTTTDLKAAVTQTVAARLSDAARDTIDKVDRNLFERYCDVQSWTAFDEIRDAAVGGDASGAVSSFLTRLHKIYEVYSDIYLLDLEGNIVATAIRRDLRGQNQNDRAWFRQAAAGQVYVSEVYHSDSVNMLTMAFSAPVKNADGKVVGVLTTRFNWDFIYGILDAVIVDSKSKVYLLNHEGILIGSGDRQGILQKSFANLQAYRQLGDRRAGQTVEKDPAGIEQTFGYSRTLGYNTYVGKGWSVLIARPTDNVAAPVLEFAKKSAA